MKHVNFSPNEIDIKRFKKGKRIAKGGFGYIYKVEEKETGELYVAKIIDCGDDIEQCNKMIEREIGIMISMQHPTIIRFIGYSKVDFQDENNITIIMEYAKKGSLADVLKSIQNNNGPKDYTNTTRQIILVGIARGMKYLHDHRIIHRDLKPGNILLDDDLHPHITDFGLSKKIEINHSYSQTKNGGTLAYESPEILREERYSFKVDVYSFGILMYEVLMDSVPYPDLLNGKLKDYEFKLRVINKSYRPKFNFPIKKSLRQLIEKCWSNDPNERPSFDEIFNKLSNRIKSEEEENYLLDDVDMEEFNIYIDDISEATDQIDQLLQKIECLQNTNQKLTTENKQQLDQIKTLEKSNQKLKTENIQQLDHINLLENSNQKLKTENNQLLEQIETLEKENQKLKTENNQQLDQIKLLEIENQKFKIESSHKIDETEQSDESDYQVDDVFSDQHIDEIPNQSSNNSKCDQNDGGHLIGNRGRGGRPKQFGTNEIQEGSTQILQEEIDSMIRENDNGYYLEMMQNDEKSPLHPTKPFDEIITGPMSGPILQVIDDLNFFQPSRIQSQAIPILNDGQSKDLIAQAQSGSGTTVAFIVSMLLHVDPEKYCLQTICLCHTRELTMQTFNVFNEMNKYTRLVGDYCVNNNDANATPPNKEAQLLFGTPTSFTFWIKEGKLDISQINFLVIDEADVILDRGSPLFPSTAHLLNILPQNVQYAFFSSTFKKSIIENVEWRRPNIFKIRLRRNHQRVQTVTHWFTRVENQDEGFKSILDLVTIVTEGQTWIFARSKKIIKEIYI